MAELGLDDRDTESDAGRARIRDRFFNQFGLLSDEELASRTSLAGRTIKRWRQRNTTPQQAQAKIMLDLLRQGLSVLVANEQELARIGEQARRANEQRQQKILHSEVNTLADDIPMPPYYQKARGRIFERKYAEAALALEYWAAPPPDGGIEDVPEKTRPYLLNSYALCIYFMGRSQEAIEAWRDAHDHGIKVKADVNLLCGVRMMQGNALWRAKRFDDAFEIYDTLLKERPHFHYVYYNALCAASEETDPIRLALWMGRLQVAAKEYVAPEAFDEMLGRIESDPDLDWARRQGTWAAFSKWMTDVRRSMTGRPVDIYLSDHDYKVCQKRERQCHDEVRRHLGDRPVGAGQRRDHRFGSRRLAHSQPRFLTRARHDPAKRPCLRISTFRRPVGPKTTNRRRRSSRG